MHRISRTPFFPFFQAQSRGCNNRKLHAGTILGACVAQWPKKRECLRILEVRVGRLAAARKSTPRERARTTTPVHCGCLHRGQRSQDGLLRRTQRNSHTFTANDPARRDSRQCMVHVKHKNEVLSTNRRNNILRFRPAMRPDFAPHRPDHTAHAPKRHLQQKKLKKLLERTPIFPTLCVLPVSGTANPRFRPRKLLHIKGESSRLGPAADPAGPSTSSPQPANATPPSGTVQRGVFQRASQPSRSAPARRIPQSVPLEARGQWAHSLTRLVDGFLDAAPREKK
jgi:hypothetical protein